MGRDKEGMGSIGSIIHGGANRLPASQVDPTVNVLSDQYRSVPALTHPCFYLFCNGVCVVCVVFRWGLPAYRSW